jgi:hypothetical protein
LPNETNRHVSRLNGYLPLDAGASALFQEYVDPDDHPSLPTRALTYLEQVVSDGPTELRLLVLTGDAGHGKTHLCAKLLESRGYSALEAREALTTRCDGSHDLVELSACRSLRIVKDLSEFPVEQGAGILTRATASPATLTIVCANEGRLRSALALKKETLAAIRTCLDEGLASGRLDVDPRVVVLNLNFQSVASTDNSLVRELLREWAVDRRRWTICARCDAKPGCPIYENHRLMSDGARGATRVAAVEALLQTAERIGAVITIRELLMLVAYAMTGGYRCTDVHRRSGRRDWQHDFEFTQNLFGERLTPSQRGSLRSLRQLRLVDPGSVALRTVDDALTPERSEAEGMFLPREASVESAAVTTRAQAKTAAQATRNLFRFMRRRDFFAPRNASVASLRRLGFAYGAAFIEVVRGDLVPADFRRLRDQLIAGIEAIQGVRRSGPGRHLLLVDPAFNAGTTAASIVARHIPITSVGVGSQSSSWARELRRDADLPGAVDWSDRSVAIEIADGGEAHAIHVDLLTFEYLMRAGEGLDGRVFFDAEVRRIAGALAPLVQRTDDDDQIEIVRDGRIEGLVIDTGDVIRKVDG